ncbi:hypothetical protein BFINE_09540 [Bacteroides finegoldii DSM 17565]|nr:hypothetical protein BFINE_09540 [Bacteroides finegoldii DSM 17565]
MLHKTNIRGIFVSVRQGKPADEKRNIKKGKNIMARPKKVQKVKEPVRVRQRKLANGNMSLYLDVYVKGVRKVESLGLYLVPELTPLDRQQNIHARQVADKIKAERILALQNHGVRQWNKVKRSCITLVDFLKEYEQEKFGFSASTLKGRRDLRGKSKRI